MNTDMKKQVTKLLETYPERERQISLLHYEMQHSARVSPEEVIDGMALGDGMGRISNKTLYIPLNYQERMDRMNAEAANEIAQRLLELEQDRLRYYVFLLEKREADVTRSFYIEDVSWEEIAQKIGVALRTVHKIKNRAVDHLSELYAYKAGLK